MGVLIKFVVSAISSYVMASSKIPLSWSQNVDKWAINVFWIGRVTIEKFFSPISWE